MGFKNIITRAFFSKQGNPDPAASFGNISYAQEGEDILLKRLFNNRESGFYVDVGAHHPFRFSNTYLFYKKGWRGINIDAMPGSMTAFDQYRSRDINLEKAISNSEEEFEYYIFNEKALNTFDKDEADKKQQIEPYKIESVKTIRTQTLSSILEAYLPKNTAIDFMSVDVEGLDLKVLRSNDWSKFRPYILLVEDLRLSLEQIFERDVYRYLKEKNYSLTSKTLNTLFFTDNIKRGASS